MNSHPCKIVKLPTGGEIPYYLLLLADETIEAIEKYIFDSEVYLAFEHNNSFPIGAFALYHLNEGEVEVKNIAIVETMRGKGIGSYLLDEIKKIAKEKKYKSITVGTADAAYSQIKFYQKNGFEKFDVRTDFFILNYPKPITENGKRLKDMIMLKTEL